MMHSKFRRPTIKANGRAYTRLFTEYLKAPDTWTAFIARYRIESIPHGLAKNGDCAIQVIDPATGQLAVLGLNVPCVIKFHDIVEPSRQFWNEFFLSADEQRSRTIEVGLGVAKDDVQPRQ